MASINITIDVNNTALAWIAMGSTVSVVSSMATASLNFVPSLLRPLDPKSLSPNRKKVTATPAPSRPPSNMRVPTLSTVSTDDGRLTPQPRDKSDPFATSSASSKGCQSCAPVYQVVARQFAPLMHAYRATEVPVQLLAFAGYATLAYRSGPGSHARKFWIASASLVAVVFPFTHIAMDPLVHKLLRIGGDEEKVEPYEDAPPDREAEKGNVVEFLQQWSVYNVVRLGAMLTALVSAAKASQLE